MKTKSPKKAVASRSGRLASGGINAKLVRIGNSRGIRLPKSVIEQVGLSEKVKISVNGDSIVIRSATEPNPRAGWEEQIKAVVAEHGDDIEDWSDWQNMPNKFDEKEWTW